MMERVEGRSESSMNPMEQKAEAATVAAREGEQRYGGPEEGGWYYKRR